MLLGKLFLNDRTKHSSISDMYEGCSESSASSLNTVLSDMHTLHVMKALYFAYCLIKLFLIS